MKMISVSHCLLTFMVSMTVSWIAITNAQQIQQYRHHSKQQQKQKQEWNFFKRKTAITVTFFHSLIFVLL